MDTYDVELGARIRAKRLEKHWTQAELAERLREAGLSTNRETISRWEAGRTQIMATSLKHLAQALSTSIDDLNYSPDDPNRIAIHWNSTLNSLPEDEKMVLKMYRELDKENRRFILKQMELLRRMNQVE